MFYTVFIVTTTELFYSEFNILITPSVEVFLISMLICHFVLLLLLRNFFNDYFKEKLNIKKKILIGKRKQGRSVLKAINEFASTVSCGSLFCSLIIQGKNEKC